MPTLQQNFQNGSESTAVLIAGGLICGLGILDDRWELDALTKFAGQILSAGVMVLLGVQLLLFYVPFGNVGTVTLGRDQAVGLTIFLCVLTINAMNFLDGLDGLVAGIAAISALAFFAYSYHLSKYGYDDVAFTPILISAVLAGACLGFLPHNFQPAKVFMGDSGSMLIGLMLAASATTATSRTDSQTFGVNIFAALPLTLPLLIPAAVLAIPLVDLALAVVRRLRAGRSPFAPDKMHLHHKLLEIGHSHRRAVLLIYFWSGFLAFGGVAISLVRTPVMVLPVLGVLLVIGILFSSVPRLRIVRRSTLRGSDR